MVIGANFVRYDVHPTNVEMNRAWKCTLTGLSGLPHKRGDEPAPFRTIPHASQAEA